MGALDKFFEDEVAVRQYLASVIGPTRAPYGQRSQKVLSEGQSVEIARNSTRDRVLFVTVGRGLLNQQAGINATVTFSQADSVGTNDFSTLFGSGSVFRFTLRPGESLSMLLVGTANPVGTSIVFSFGAETF